jgi:hypothetical protein
MGMVRRAEDDQVGLTPLCERLQRVCRRALLDVDDLELTAVALDDPLGQHPRVLATLVLQVADHDLRVDGRCFGHWAEEGMSTQAPAVRCLCVDSLRAENRVEQAGEASVEILATKLGELRGPLALLADHAGLPQDAVVVGHRRLGDPELDRPTRTGLSGVRQPPDDLEPLWVTESVQNRRELDLVAIRMMKLRRVINSHGSIVRR